MTEEVPEVSKSDYGFPDSWEEDVVPEGSLYSYPDVFFRRLEDLEDNGSDYCLVQGALYDWLDGDCRVSDSDAMEVARYLNKGMVEDAEEFTYEVLEE